MRRLICAFVVRIWQKQISSWRGSNTNNKLLIFWNTYEPRHDKTNKESDQSLRCPQEEKPWVLSYPLSAQWRLWSDWADAQAQADLSRRWAHTHFVGFVMSWLIYRLFERILKRMYIFLSMPTYCPFEIKVLNYANKIIEA